MRKVKFGFFLVLLVLSIINVNAQEKSVIVEKFDFAKHPYNVNKSVTCPTYEMLGYKPQFTILRDFWLDSNGNIMYKKLLSEYTDKFDLGTVVWPNGRFLKGKNMVEFCQALKEKNLYLYQIWGYVPGNSEGTWMEYSLDEKISKIFQDVLGDSWWGMDMGEQDGRQMSYVNQYSHVHNRLEGYYHFREHIGSIEDQMQNKIASLTTTSYNHYLARTGKYTSVCSEVAQMHPNAQVIYSFNRGAGKQYGVPWFGNVSYFNRFGYKNYWSKKGKTAGTSLSLMKRLLYSHIMYNCMVVGFEGNWIYNNKLTPIGEVQYNAKKFVEKHKDFGVMQTPVALLQDFHSGWTPPNYNGNLLKVWNRLNYEQGDYLTHNLFDLTYPGYANSSFFHDESGFMTPTPYGDGVDALLSDAPSWLLSHYDLILVGSDLQYNKELELKLIKYVKNGGKIILTANNAKKYCSLLDGVIFREKNLIKDGQEIYEIYDVDLTSNDNVIDKINDKVFAFKRQLGKGEITVMTSPYGATKKNQVNLPLHHKVDQDFPNPYPLVNRAKKIYKRELSKATYFNMNNELTYIVNYKGDNKFWISIYNSTLKPLNIDLKSNCGKIIETKEIAIPSTEKNNIGYLPTGLSNAKIGNSSSNVLAGYDMKIIEIKIENGHLTERKLNYEEYTTHNIYLPLRNFANLKTEILKRPNLKNNFEGILVDSRFIKNIEAEECTKLNSFIKGENLKVIVDLSNEIDLYPNVRFINSVSEQYIKSQRQMMKLLYKSHEIGATDVIIRLHSWLEGNFTKEQQEKEFGIFLQFLCNIAKKLDITMHIRPNWPGYRVIDFIDIAKIVKKVDSPRLKLAISNTSCKVDKSAISVLKKIEDKYIGLLLVASSKANDGGQIVSVTEKINENTNINIIKKYKEKLKLPIILDGYYENKSEEISEKIKLMKMLEDK